MRHRSVAISLAYAAVALSLPEHPRPRRPGVSGRAAYLTQLRSGLREVRRRPVVRRAVLLAAALGGISVTDEYLPLWTRETGAPTVAVPLLLLLPAAAMAAAGWWADRWAGVGARRLGTVLAVAALLFGIGAASGHPAAMLPIAIYCGVWTVTVLVAEARLQETIDASARATVLSVSGFGGELFALSLFGAYALGSLWWANAYCWRCWPCPWPSSPR